MVHELLLPRDRADHLLPSFRGIVSVGVRRVFLKAAGAVAITSRGLDACFDPYRVAGHYHPYRFMNSMAGSLRRSAITAGSSKLGKPHPSGVG